MGFRFRKSFKVLPGVRLNLSKSGTSWSLGKPGATVNLKGDRVRGTVGIPGTGLSYSETARSGEAAPAEQELSGEAKFSIGLVVFLVVVLVVMYG